MIWAGLDDGNKLHPNMEDSIMGGVHVRTISSAWERDHTEIQDTRDKEEHEFPKN